MIQVARRARDLSVEQTGAASDGGAGFLRLLRESHSRKHAPRR
jgi:hypothetical protein